MSLQDKLKEIEDRANAAKTGNQDAIIRFSYHAIDEVPKLLAVIKLLFEKNEGWCRLYHKHAAMYYNEEYSEQSIIEDMASDRLEIAKILGDAK